MIKVFRGDLFEHIMAEGIDGIMNAANGTGPMGRGIAGAIKKHGGRAIQTDAFRACKELNPQTGEAYSTISGDLISSGVKRIIHAVTMKAPGGPTSIEIVGRAFEAAILLAKKEGIQRLGCTALGTGVGRLDPVEVSKTMIKIAVTHTGNVTAQSDFNIIFVDMDSFFINSLKWELRPVS